MKTSLTSTKNSPEGNTEVATEIVLVNLWVLNPMSALLPLPSLSCFCFLPPYFLKASGTQAPSYFLLSHCSHAGFCMMEGLGRKRCSLESRRPGQLQGPLASRITVGSMTLICDMGVTELNRIQGTRQQSSVRAKSGAGPHWSSTTAPYLRGGLRCSASLWTTSLFPIPTPNYHRVSQCQI